MQQPQLSGIASALAKQGRHGDDTLVHVSRKELAMLERMGDGIGVHMTKNPQTGLPEAFNWLGTLGGIAGGVIGTIIAPGAGTAAGAALGSGLGTAAGGGSLQQSLIAGVLGGITGYIGGAGAGELASAGEAELTKQAVEQGAQQVAQDVAGGSITQSALSNIPADTLAQTTEAMTANGVAPEVQATALNNMNATYGAQNAPILDKLQAGWNATPGAFAGQGATIAKTAAGLGSIGMIKPTETSIVNPDSGSSDSGYKGESYIDPATGQMRTRAVKMAEGGPTFSDYDAADAEADGGYSPGGVAALSNGGDADVDASEGGLPAYMAEGARLGSSRFRREDYAMGGGIGDLGSFSDGGRLLKGPGDGISDNIPATIENKRPARLADGEFVVPARAVSELGNGSTEAGSKQLYKMLDRIAAKRKTGKGLAYQANPQKMLPA